MNRPDNRWRALRKALGMDQTEFASMAKTSRSTISRLERDETSLREKNIVALESELGIRIQEVLGDVPPPSWLGEYLSLPAHQRAAVDKVLMTTIEVLKTLK